MNIPVEDLLQIIARLPTPHQAGQFHIVQIMPKVNVTKEIAPPRPVRGGKNETELHFRSCSYYNEPFVRWTLEI